MQRTTRKLKNPSKLKSRMRRMVTRCCKKIRSLRGKKRRVHRRKKARRMKSRRRVKKM